MQRFSEKLLTVGEKARFPLSEFGRSGRNLTGRTQWIRVPSNCPRTTPRCLDNFS